MHFMVLLKWQTCSFQDSALRLWWLIFLIATFGSATNFLKAVSLTFETYTVSGNSDFLIPSFSNVSKNISVFYFFTLKTLPPSPYL